MRRLSAVLCTLLLLSACSEAEPPDGASADGPADTKAERDRKEPREAKGKTSPKRVKPSSAGSKQRPRTGGAADDGDPGGATFAEGDEDDRSSAAYPAAGRYLFAQEGYEEFCQGGQCDRRDLPKEQSVAVTHQHATRDRAVVVTDQRASGNRLVRTTSVYTRDRALITNVYFRYEYQGFAYEDSYDPDPPVVYLRFPLRVGSDWSGRWEADTSGDYRMEVKGRDSVSVGGASVDALKVHSVTNFRGELDGRGEATLWIDPATRALVKSRGFLDITSTFGRYATRFTVTLDSGPGYR